MKLRTLTLAALTLTFCTVASWAQMPQIPQFSADMKMTGKKGEDSTGKVNFGNMHMRMEIASHGRNVIMIMDMTNPANAKTAMLMPEQKMYMEMSAFGAGPGMRQKAPSVRVYDPNNPCAGEEGETCKKVGVETVNGYACDKWEFSGKTNQTVWIAQNIHFPIKSAQQDGTTVEFTNIKEGPQDGNLFTVPADYKKFDMGAMMGGHQQQ